MRYDPFLIADELAFSAISRNEEPSEVLLNISLQAVCKLLEALLHRIKVFKLAICQAILVIVSKDRTPFEDSETSHESLESICHELDLDVKVAHLRDQVSLLLEVVRLELQSLLF